MTPAAPLRDRSWGAFRLLEMASIEGVRVKRGVALIANTDARTGGASSWSPVDSASMEARRRPRPAGSLVRDHHRHGIRRQ